LIAYYPFEGNANDKSGNNIHGMVFGATLTEDRFGRSNSAFDFDGIDDYLFVQSSQFSKITSDVSISMWVKLPQQSVSLLILSSTQKFIFGSTQSYDFRWHGGGFGFDVIHNGGFVAYLGANLADNQWHQVVGVSQNGNSLKIYQDGVLKGTQASDKTLKNLEYLYIGGWEGTHGLEYPKATLDEILIYNRTLSESEIWELYQAGQLSGSQNSIPQESLGVPNIITLAFKCFWLLAIIMIFFNAYYLKLRSRPLVKVNPDLEEGFTKVFWGTIIFGGAPWLVMGVGMTIGGLATPFHFFRPRAGNPYVIAFHLTLILIWILAVIWIYFKDGADFWVKYIVPLRGSSPLTRSVTGVKIWFALCLLGGLVAMIMMWIIDLPAPDF